MEATKRTQIYLPSQLSEALGRLARRRGTSKANLIRIAARRLLDQEELAGDDPILGLIGLGNAGRGRVSEDHDRLLAEHSRGGRAR